MNRCPEELAERFFLGNAESYDHIARLSTLGLDGWWSRHFLRKFRKRPGEFSAATLFSAPTPESSASVYQERRAE